MEIRISLQSAVIILLSIIILVGGAFFYRGYDMLAVHKQNQEQQAFIQEFQRRLLMLQVTPEVSKLFTDMGLKTNTEKPIFDELQQKVNKQGEK